MQERRTPEHSPVAVRPIDRSQPAEMHLVADRMRATLLEVLGPEGGTLYTLDWLRERVRWHLRSDVCTGEVLLAVDSAECIVGHLIIRIEQDQDGRHLGLISTIYVLPSWRGAGVSKALLDTGEAWLRGRRPSYLATDTADTNVPLIRLFEGRGYAITFHSPEKRMVRLSRPE